LCAEQRLADALPLAWEGADIRVVGVVAELPQAYDRSLRFEFDVERVLTLQAAVPAHIALSWWGSQAGGAPRRQSAGAARRRALATDRAPAAAARAD